jgi:hypothetical protein
MTMIPTIPILIKEKRRMSYTPKLKVQAPADSALPKDLADALTTAERVLAERDKLHGTLQRTHVRIPELLARKMTVQAELGRAEIEGKDTSAIREQRLTIESERLSAVAQREGSIQALLDQEGSLTAARDTLDVARQPYNADALRAFNARYVAGVAQLQRLWQEADALSGALRVEVAVPLPVKISGGPVPTVCGTGFPEYVPIKVERDLGPVTAPPAIDPAAKRTGACLDGLGAAINFSAGLRESLSRQRTGRPFDGKPIDFTATYRTVQPIRCLFDGLEFAPNTLVDVSLLGPIPLSRHLATKGIRLENGGGLKAVAA